MAEEIRGLSIRFDADFSEFKKGMKSAEKDIGSTQRQLKTLQESLKLNWDPKKFQQAQTQAQQALEATEKKAGLLRERLAAIESQGITDKTRDEYNWLSEEINKTELSAQRLHSQLEQLEDIRLTNLTAGLDKASKGLATAAQKTQNLSRVAGATVAGLAALGLSTVAQADEVATLATQYKMSTDAIQRFNYVALQTDTASDALYKAFVKVQGGVADLKTGVESVSTKALTQLNLSFDQFSGAEEQFYGIIDALSKMEDEAKMVSLANDIFGERMATNLFPLMYAGTDAVNAYRAEFEEMGALTEDQVTRLAEFDNVLNNLKTQYVNVGLELGEGLLPVMQTFSEVLTEDVLPIIRDIVEWFKGLDENQQKTLVSLLLLTAALSPALKMFGNAAGGISTVVKWLGKMDKATLSSYGKWALLAAAIGSLFNVIAHWSEMNTVQKIIGLLGALSAAALAAAVAFGVFHSAWSLGIAIAGIVAGIAAATAAVAAAGKDIGVETTMPSSSGSSGGYYDIPEFTIPSESSGGSVTTDNSSYTDNSTTNITIEKNEYMTDDDIIRAVNRGLREAKQSRT